MKEISTYSYFFKAPLATKEVAVVAVNSPVSLGEHPTSFPCPSRKVGEQHPDLQHFPAGLGWDGDSKLSHSPGHCQPHSIPG